MSAFFNSSVILKTQFEVYCRKSIKTIDIYWTFVYNKMNFLSLSCVLENNKFVFIIVH